MVKSVALKVRGLGYDIIGNRGVFTHLQLLKNDKKYLAIFEENLCISTDH